MELGSHSFDDPLIQRAPFEEGSTGALSMPPACAVPHYSFTRVNASGG